MKKLLFFLIAFLLTGCEKDFEYDQRQNESKSISLDTQNRFQLTRVSIFTDRLAYKDQRGIYVLFDSKTGIEYVGISGIGISELGSHGTGKTLKKDER